MAVACFLLVTFLPLRPLLSVPALRRSIAVDAIEICLMFRRLLKSRSFRPRRAQPHLQGFCPGNGRANKRTKRIVALTAFLPHRCVVNG